MGGSSCVVGRGWMVPGRWHTAVSLYFEKILAERTTTAEFRTLNTFFFLLLFFSSPPITTALLSLYQLHCCMFFFIRINSFVVEMYAFDAQKTYFKAHKHKMFTLLHSINALFCDLSDCRAATTFLFVPPPSLPVLAFPFFDGTGPAFFRSGRVHGSDGGHDVRHDGEGVRAGPGAAGSPGGARGG